MQKTHYLKREKNGKLIQLIIVKETSNDFGLFPEMKQLDIDPDFKNRFYYLEYSIPHEELTEVKREEFMELYNRHFCEPAKHSLPPPQHVHSS